MIPATYGQQTASVRLLFGLVYNAECEGTYDKTLIYLIFIKEKVSANLN